MKRVSRPATTCLVPAALSALLGCLLAFAISCSSVPRYPRPGDFVGVGSRFSGEIVVAHRSALGGLGPRWPGNPADQTARAYLSGGFQRHGAKLRDFSKAAANADDARLNFYAEIPGDSQDVLLLVAPYPVLGSWSWVDDTGAAILLELARVFDIDTPAYSLRFALAEIRPRRMSRGAPSESAEDAVMGETASQGWERVETPEVARQRVIEAGRSLAEKIEAAGGADRIRAVIILDLGADLRFRFRRDLRSHPGFRQLFWDTATRLGEESMFPRTADWMSTGSLQLGFRERGVNRILALVNDRTSPTEAPSTDELASFGRVVADGLNHLMRRFEKVDAFSR